MWAILPFEKYIHGLNELIAEVNRPGGGSARAIAVVGGALLEEAVERTLRERLIDDSTTMKVADRLVKPENALGNMSTQMDLLYLLGAFDQKILKALKGLAGVRNFFAHDPHPRFDSLDARFVQSINALTLHEGRECYPHRLWGPDTKFKIESISTRQDQFIVNLKLALIFLMRDRVSHHAYSNLPRTEEDLLKTWPDRFKENGEPGS
jgi:DNA-binding MltR family transcriptional regulator